MIKKKAVICTIMFAIVFYGIYAILILTLPDNLYHSLPSFISGIWMTERVEKFYKWLIKDRD